MTFTVEVADADSSPRLMQVAAVPGALGAAPLIRVARAGIGVRERSGGGHTSSAILFAALHDEVARRRWYHAHLRRRVAQLVRAPP